MYQKNPLLQESNAKSFAKYIDTIRRSPNNVQNLEKLRNVLTKKVGTQRSLPGLETMAEKKLAIVQKAIARKLEQESNRKLSAKAVERIVMRRGK